MSTPTYYQTLGVRPSASHDQVRGAYRDLARRLHPDRQTGASGAERALAERRMREINQAWMVLGDRSARTRYDEALARAQRVRPGAGPVRPMSTTPRRQGSGGSGAVAPTDDDDLVEVGPEVGPVGSVVMRGLPWVAVLGVLIVIFVVTAYAAGGKSDSAPTTTATVRAGQCVRIDEPGPVAVSVPCSTSGARHVITVAGPGEECPTRTELRRLQPGPVDYCLAAT